MIKRVSLSGMEDTCEQDSTRAHVMVVDDSATVRKILETCLRRVGYTVSSFYDGIEALGWLTESQHDVPDLIVLDVNLPKMDGYEVARRLKSKPQLSNTVIIMLTRRDSIIDKLKAHLAGATDYLTKPFKTEEIVSIIQTHLPAEKQTQARVISSEV